MTDVERRKQERYAIWVDATVQTQGTSISAIATDISGDGIRIQSQKSLSPGTKIQINLKLKAKNEFLGTIAWALYAPYSTPNGYEMGVKNDLIVFENFMFNTYSGREKVVEEILAIIN